MTSGTGQAAALVYVSDVRYIVPLAVSIRSAQLSTADRLFVTVLCDGVSEAHRRAVLASVPDPDRVRFVELAAGSLPQHVGRGITGRVSRAAFALLQVPRDLVHPDRFVYLDADTVVRADLGQLLATNLASAVVGAAYDHSYTVFERRTDRLAAVGVPPGRRFNSGVLLISTAGWFGERVGERARQVAMDHHVMDQGALNAVCHGRWHELDPGWNVTTQVLLRSHEFRTDPSRVLVRHLTAVKPWLPERAPLDRDRLMLQEFYGHLADTVWGGRPGPGRSRNPLPTPAERALTSTETRQ